MSDVLVSGIVDHGGANAATTSGPIVMVSATVGYFFFKESGTESVKYSKTEDAGETWSAGVTVITTSGPLGTFAVWWDQMTPGDSGTKIHVAALDMTVSNTHRYRALDTNGDSLGTEVGFHTLSIFSGSDSNSKVTISKSRGGNIYIGGWHFLNGTSRWFVRSTDGGANFTARTKLLTGNSGDIVQMTPGNEADNDDMYVAYFDNVANELVIQTYDDSGDSWSSSTVAVLDSAGGPTPGSFIATAVRHSDKHSFVAFHNKPGDAGNDLELWEITNATTFAKLTNVVENDSTARMVTLTVDQGTGDIYIGWLDDGTGGTDAFTVYKKWTGSLGSVVGMSEKVDYIGQEWLFSTRTVPATGGLFIMGWGEDGAEDVFVSAVNAVGLSPVPTFAISSTIIATANEDQVAEGSLEIVATIVNQTWKAALGSDDPATEDFLAAFVSAQNEALGWNAIVVGNNYRKKVVDDTPIMYIRGNAVTDLGSLGVSAAATDLSAGNALLLSSAQKSYRYNLRGARLVVTDEAGLLNLFAGGGTYEAVILPWASGWATDTGTMIFKENGYTISTDNQQGGFVDIFLRREFSTAGGVWVLRGVVPIGLQSHVVITYDDSATTNDPTFYINGIVYTVANGHVEETQTPQGTATSDTGKDIFVGSNSALSGAVAFNGDMQEVALYTSVLTQAQIDVHVNAASYQYGLDFNDVTRTSATVITVDMREFPFYDIVVQETITVIFPDTTHSGTDGDETATPTFTIDPTSRITGYTPLPGQVGFVFGNVNGGLGPAAGDAFRILGAGDSWEFGMPQMSIGLAGTDLPRILLVRVTEISEDDS